jgi:hypothetical protein
MAAGDLEGKIDGMALLFARPEGGFALSVAPELASWDKAGSPGQVRLAAFLAHAGSLAAPAIASADGPVAVELTVGLPPAVPLTSGGRDLDNYLYPLAQHLGAGHIQAMFGRKVNATSSVLAICAAEPQPIPVIPAFAARITGSYEHPQWKTSIREALQARTRPIPHGPLSLDIAITTGPGRNWAILWKPLIDSFGPLLGEDPARPFHPRDDRITSLGLHHHIDTAIGHDVAIEATWAQP